MNKQEVIATLNRIGIKPNKLKGQNFLVDEKVLQTIIETSGAGRGSTVVEVGPGLGVLTEALLKAGARVIALEQERQFVEYLRKKFDGSPLSVLAGNAVLKIPELKLPPEYAVVSNLPYSITSPVINLFLTRVSPRPMSLTLMVQGEVAERPHRHSPLHNKSQTHGARGDASQKKIYYGRGNTIGQVGYDRVFRR